MFFTFSLYSQIDSGNITYSIEPLYIKSTKAKDIELKNLLIKMNKAKLKIASEVEYQLTFNKNHSLFKVNKKGITNIRWFKVGIIYTSVFGEILRKKDIYGSTFLISSNVNDINWKLSTETRKIGKYISYKATAVKTIINSKGTFYRNITAWYCPELNFPFGPMGYGNLPGLILELKIDKKGIYTAREVLLNPKEEIIIKSPTKGKRVTEKEFNEIGRKAYERRKNGM